jgi:hypothetical protein
MQACENSSSASDNQTKTIDPGPTAAVDACDAVATRRDERVPMDRETLVNRTVFHQTNNDTTGQEKTYPEPPLAFP